MDIHAHISRTSANRLSKFQHYRPANPGHGQPHHQQPQQHHNHGSGAGPSGAPPPYPGRNISGGGAALPGPGHGYGEGRGHYNRSRSYEERQAVGGPAALNQSVPSGRDRRSGGAHGNRSSRIEMTPMR